jgi:hypothetical protein
VEEGLDSSKVNKHSYFLSRLWGSLVIRTRSLCLPVLGVWEFFLRC